MKTDGRMKVGFEGRFTAKIVQLREKGTRHATVQPKFRSCVKFQGNETNIKGVVLVHLGAENAVILPKMQRVNTRFEGRYQGNDLTGHLFEVLEGLGRNLRSQNPTTKA